MTRYGQIAVKCLEVVSKRATDRYGRIHSPIWVGTLDAQTLDCPRYRMGTIRRVEVYEAMRRTRLKNELAGSSSYSSDVPKMDGRRAIRVSQRGAGCCNLYYDQPMLRAGRLAKAGQHQKAIAAYLSYYLAHFVDPQLKLLNWGWHIHYDPFEDAFVFWDGYHHEIQIILPDWPLLYEANPKVIHQEIDQIWHWHIDEDMRQLGRHPDKGKGCSFAMAGGEFCLALAFLYAASKDPEYLRRAMVIADIHWERRNRKTDLIPNRVPEHSSKDRFDFHTSDTSVPGLWASRVLLAGVISQSSELKQIALAQLHAWAKYGWDKETKRPWGLLRLDGQPVTGPKPDQGYEKQMPTGHLDLWVEYVMGYEYPLQMALTYAMGYHYSQEEDLHASALPANRGKGTFAQNYGQLISLYVYLTELTNDERFLALGRRVADEATRLLWDGQLVRGYPGKALYESVDGPGYLVQGLWELDRIAEGKSVLENIQPFDWNL